MAERVRAAWWALQDTLCGKRRAYPRDEFYAFCAAVQTYAADSERDGLVHRDMAGFLSGFWERFNVGARQQGAMVLI
ncbi:MAG: hypothetical protein HQ523_16550 [Lentisphaerae bacterium]|nr:hypothetical protein [Lentisphaerota bacterium]